MSRPIAPARGFTLLEIAVVLFIMGLMLMIAIPHISTVRRAKLKGQVRRLAGRAAYLYDRASADKVVLSLTFDLDADTYSVSRLDPYGPQPVFLPDRDPGMGPVLLPAGIRLRDVTIDGIGTVTRGTASCFFYPEGYVDATVVHLIDDSGEVFTLALDPMTGRVAITDGDVGPKTAMMLPQ
jgi:prepilin-type N-terminal cleavage/methylation domain-containing protein